MLQAYTRPRDVVGAASFHHRADRLRISSPPRSGASSCCRRASCPRRTPRARCWRSSCRRARSLPTPKRPPKQSSRGCASGPRSRACSSTAGGCRRASSRSASATLIINYAPKPDRSDHAARARAGDQPRTRKRPRYPLLVPRRERPARHLAGRDRHRQRHRQQRRRRTRHADAADSADHQCGLGNLARPAGTAHLAAPRSRGTARRLHREPVGNHPRRHHRRRRPRRSPSSTPATGWCRSACSSRTARAATCRSSSSCGCRSAAAAAACRFPPSPTSSSTRARPASTAMTANVRPPSRPTWSAPRRSATPPRRSTNCR